MLDQGERVKGQLVDLQAARIVNGLCTIASIEIVALKKGYCHVHVILSTVLQAFRFTHEHSLRLAMVTPQLTMVHDLCGKHRTTPKVSTLITPRAYARRG